VAEQLDREIVGSSGLVQSARVANCSCQFTHGDGSKQWLCGVVGVEEWSAVNCGVVLVGEAITRAVQLSPKVTLGGGGARENTGLVRVGGRERAAQRPQSLAVQIDNRLMAGDVGDDGSPAVYPSGFDGRVELACGE
jgi:hypothetical protein